MMRAPRNRMLVPRVRELPLAVKSALDSFWAETSVAADAGSPAAWARNTRVEAASSRFENGEITLASFVDVILTARAEITRRERGGTP